jgi:hypothetical protein
VIRLTSSQQRASAPSIQTDRSEIFDDVTIIACKMRSEMTESIEIRKNMAGSIPVFKGVPFGQWYGFKPHDRVYKKRRNDSPPESI